MYLVCQRPIGWINQPASSDCPDVSGAQMHDHHGQTTCLSGTTTPSHTSKSYRRRPSTDAEVVNVMAWNIFEHSTVYASSYLRIGVLHSCFARI